MNVWHHAAATYDGTTWAVYLDGSSRRARTSAPALRHHPARRAWARCSFQPARSARPPVAFQGVLDEARVWNVAALGCPDPRSKNYRADLGHRLGRSMGDERSLRNDRGRLHYRARQRHDHWTRVISRRPVRSARRPRRTGCSRRQRTAQRVSRPRPTSMSSPPTRTAARSTCPSSGGRFASGDFALDRHAVGRRLGRPRHDGVAEPGRRSDLSSGSPPSTTARSRRPVRPGPSTRLPATGTVVARRRRYRRLRQHPATRRPPPSWPAWTARSSRPATTSTRPARRPNSRPATSRPGARSRAAHDPSRATTTGATGRPPGSLAGYFALLRRQRDRCRRQRATTATTSTRTGTSSTSIPSAPTSPAAAARRVAQHDWLVADLARERSTRTSSPCGTSRGSVRARPISTRCPAARRRALRGGRRHRASSVTTTSTSGSSRSTRPAASDPTYGIRHFTVGTGGAEPPRGWDAQLPTSEALNDDTFGVMKLVLHPTTYDVAVPAGRRQRPSRTRDPGPSTMHRTGRERSRPRHERRLCHVRRPGQARPRRTFTIETWFKRTGAGVSGTDRDRRHRVVHPARHPWWPRRRRLGRRRQLAARHQRRDRCAGGRLRGHGDRAGTTRSSGTTAIANNVWHHAAATYDGTTWRLYLDGQLEATEAENADAAVRHDPARRPRRDAQLGRQPRQHRPLPAVSSTRPVSGAARGPSPRSARRSTPSSQQARDLVARWGDEPRPPARSSAIRSPRLRTARSPEAAAPRVGGAPFDIVFDTTPPAAPTGLGATAGNGTVSLTWTANGEPDLAGYNVYRSTTTPGRADGTPLNGGTLLTSPAYTDNTAANGTTYYYVVTAVDDSEQRIDRVERGQRHARPRRRSSRPASTSASSRRLRRRSATRPSSTSATFTIETWFKRTGAGRQWHDRHRRDRARSSRSSRMAGPRRMARTVDANWLLGINDAGDVLAADFEDTATGLNHPISGTTVITDNVWHHAAATYDGTTWRLYLDGRLEATEVENATPRIRHDPARRPRRDARLDRRPADNRRPVSRACSTRHACGHAARNLSQIRSGHPPAARRRRPGSSPAGAMGDGSRNDRGRLGRTRQPTARSTGTGTTWPAGAPFDIPTVGAGPDQNVTLPANAAARRPRARRRPAVGADDDAGRRSPGPTRPSSPTRPRSRRPASRSRGSGTGDYVFRLTASDGTTRSSTRSRSSVLDPGPAPNFGLDFDGTNDYVTFGANPALGLPQFTLETWFRRDGAGVRRTAPAVVA